jgi:hypothetical protein
MIFTPAQVHQILARKKTQMRLPVGSGNCRYKAQRSYPVWKKPARERALGDEPVLKVIVVSIHDEPLGSISFEDARAEGFKTRDEFWEAWAERYGSVDRGRLVWVLRFKILEDEPVFLAAQPGSILSDYTTSHFHATRGEDEPVFRADQERITAEARQRYDELHADDRRRQDAKRIARQAQLAVMQGTITAEEFDAILRSKQIKAA